MVCVVSTCLIVSCTGTPGTAPSTADVGQGPQHGLEDGRRGQRTGRVVHQDHLGLVGHGGQAAAHRGRPALPARHDDVGTVPGPGRKPTASAGRTRTTPVEWARQASTAHSRTGRPPSGENCFSLAEPAARATGHHDRPHLRRGGGTRPTAQVRASFRRSSAVSSSTLRAKVSSDTRIWRARWSMRFSPADRPLSLSRMERFRTTSATW